MLKRVSIFWIIAIALLISSAVPVGVLAVRAIQTTQSGIEAEQRSQLLARVEAQAGVIDQQFQKFQVATELAAARAREILVGAPKLSEVEVAARMEKYQREGQFEIEDRRKKQEPGGDSIVYDDKTPYKLGVLGLDAYYRETFLPANPASDRLSNVFLNNLTEVTPRIAYQIAATEDLDPLFAAIYDSGIGSKWVYLTTAEGMMRLYPWAGNYKYPVNWEPHTISFYTVAAPERNPQRRSVWTRPYNDFARAGLMVTNSVPIYDGDTLVAVMSHDLLIESIQRDVLNVAVGEKGFAFLIDSGGNVVAHKAHDAKDTPLGQELNIQLGERDPGMRPVVRSMLNKNQPQGITSYIDPNTNEEWVVVYSNIPSTDWHIGLMQPLAEIIAPAREIENQLVPVAGLLLVAVLAGSILVARWIARPVRQLTDAAEEIEATVDQQPRSRFSADSLKGISGTSEITRLVTVFTQMVIALKQRMDELDSIYAIGQTITANVEYDKTLKTLLTAVGQVVPYDSGEIGILHGEDLTVQAWSGAAGLRDTTGQSVKIGYGPMGAVAATKNSLLLAQIGSIEDVQRHLYQPNYDGRQVIEGKVKSMLGIPLTLGEKLLGVLMLMHRRPGHFTEANRRQLIKLAAQASIAISNAIQVRQRETMLKEQIRELQIEIDEAKKVKQVKEIVETDFFRDLQQKADLIRTRARNTRRTGTTGMFRVKAPDIPAPGESVQPKPESRG